jgi:hypothetical protein
VNPAASAYAVRGAAVAFGPAVTDGAALATLTVTAFVSVRVPSLTTTEKVTAAGPSAGVHVRTPVVGSMLAPLGAPSRLKVSGSPSGSDAVAAMVSALPSVSSRCATGHRHPLVPHVGSTRHRGPLRLDAAAPSRRAPALTAARRSSR